MIGTQYRKIRNDINLDENRKKYFSNKLFLIDHISKFNETDNLIELCEALNLGIKILEDEGFPIKKYNKYVKQK